LSPCGDESATGVASYNPHCEELIDPAASFFLTIERVLTRLRPAFRDMGQCFETLKVTAMELPKTVICSSGPRPSRIEVALAASVVLLALSIGCSSDESRPSAAESRSQATPQAAETPSAQLLVKAKASPKSLEILLTDSGKGPYKVSTLLRTKNGDFEIESKRNDGNEPPMFFWSQGEGSESIHPFETFVLSGDTIVLAPGAEKVLVKFMGHPPSKPGKSSGGRQTIFFVVKVTK
jgi:hypothetical protein